MFVNPWKYPDMTYNYTDNRNDKHYVPYHIFRKDTSSMNIILHSIYNAISDKKYNFYVFTLLWITTLITWIPFIHTEIIFNPLLQKCSFFIHWFTTNETFLFPLLSFLFLIEAIVLMFLYKYYFYHLPFLFPICHGLLSRHIGFFRKALNFMPSHPCNMIQFSRFKIC